MYDVVIFVVGVVVSVMLFSGLAFTIFEVRRLGQEATEEQALRSRNKIAG